MGLVQRARANLAPINFSRVRNWGAQKECEGGARAFLLCAASRTRKECPCVERE